MSIKAQALALAGVASIMSGHAQAQALDPVGVAVVDVGVTRLDFDDPNVRIVQLNPTAQTKFSDRQANVSAKFTHGDIVASSFVREYRKLDPDRPIVIYAVNPYREVGGQTTIDMKAVRGAMAVLKQNNVKVAVTAFGTATENAGEIFMKPFRENGIAVFASAPNTPDDYGLYPAASKGAISISTEEKGTAYAEDRKLATWVDFTISGNHWSSSPEARGRGNSYASGHAAAYGVFISSRDPSVTAENMREAIADFGQKQGGTFAGKPIRTVRIGERGMVKEVVARYAAKPVQSAATAPKVVASVDPALQMPKAANTR